MKNDIIGIYCFENLVDGKKSVGQSINVLKRKREHLNGLASNKHWNKYFQNAYNKHGRNNFVFYVIEECPEEMLNEREIYWIKELHSHIMKHGYNVSYGGDDCWNRGISLSEEHKKKISESMPDMSGENNPNFGKHPSKETKKKISDALKGKPISEKTKQKISIAHKGKHHSGKTKQKISNALRGKTASEKAKQKMSENHADFSGENSSSSKLTEKNVLEILDLFYNNNFTRKKITERYNVSYDTIWEITRGTTWKITYENFMLKQKK